MKRIKPPFRANHVGSLLRPRALKEVRAIEDREIEAMIRRQAGERNAP